MKTKRRKAEAPKGVAEKRQTEELLRGQVDKSVPNLGGGTALEARSERNKCHGQGGAL